MKKSIFRILYSVLFLCSILCCYAQDQTIIVTPAQTISKCEGYKIVGEIYLQGSLHKTANEFANGFSSDFPLWVRGGEINLKPNEKEFILYVGE